MVYRTAVNKIFSRVHFVINLCRLTLGTKYHMSNLSVCKTILSFKTHKSFVLFAKYFSYFTYLAICFQCFLRYTSAYGEKPRQSSGRMYWPFRYFKYKLKGYRILFIGLSKCSKVFVYPFFGKSDSLKYFWLSTL